MFVWSYVRISRGCHFAIQNDAALLLLQWKKGSNSVNFVVLWLHFIIIYFVPVLSCYTFIRSKRAQMSFSPFSFLLWARNFCHIKYLHLSATHRVEVARSKKKQWLCIWRSCIHTRTHTCSYQIVILWIFAHNLLAQIPADPLAHLYAQSHRAMVFCGWGGSGSA